MHKYIYILFLLFITTNLVAQDTLMFDVKTKLFSLGKLNVIKTQSADSDTITYNLESTLTVFSFYNIDYTLNTTFLSGILCSSKCSIIVNGKYNHLCTTTLIDTIYLVQHNSDKPFTHCVPITSGVTPLYFGESIESDSIFSEYSGNYRPFIQENDSTYILDPNNPMEFIFREGRINRVVVPNPIMDFYIILAH